MSELAGDETRRPPPGHRAENWGRRDNIRAGAVSGPWRSAPRSGAPDGSVPEAAGETGPHAAPAETSQAPAPHQERRPQPGRGSGSVTGGVVFGALAAVALVIAALMLRPDVLDPLLDPEPMPDPAMTSATPPIVASETPPVAPEPEAEPEPEVEAVAPLPVLAPPGTAMRLRVGPGVSPDQETEIVAALQAGGSSVAIERVPFRIATSRVGYYHQQDRDAAHTLAAGLAPLIGAAPGSVPIRDYSELVPDADGGRLDVWVGN